MALIQTLYTLRHFVSLKFMFIYSRKATKIWQNLQTLFEISIKNYSNFKNLNYLLLAFYSNNIINYIAIRIWKNETIQSVIKNY